ncbi:MAG: chemotaxis protein [Magnetococcales bacterium]|nr:chemotaxis protein [Magnetococcales bacterium]
MKITHRLIAAALLLFLSVGAGVISIYSQVDEMTGDARVVNHAGIVRGASQRVVKLEIAGVESDKLIKKIDRIIKGLIEGDRELGLNRAVDTGFIEKMQAVLSSWNSLKNSIITVRSNALHRDILLQKSEAHFETTNAAVFTAERVAEEKVLQLKQLLLLLSILSFLLIGGIVAATRSMVAALKSIMDMIVSTSTEISTTMNEQERILSQQAEAVSETSVTMQELKNSANETSKKAETVATTAKNAMESTNDGLNQMDAMRQAMEDTKQKVDVIALQIVSLKEQSGQISKITSAVTDFTNETKMLAMNASIEAVRAGEHGKGFSVLSVEIRNLAEESKSSSEQIIQLVEKIQRATDATEVATITGTNTVESGMSLVHDTSCTFNQLANLVVETSENSAQISLNIKQQAQAMLKVVEAMESLTTGAKENALGIGYVKRGVVTLDSTAKTLQGMV